MWEAIVDSAIIAEDALNAHLQRIKPDLVAVDNVILFPAIKRAGCPWVRIISCSENEIPDPDIPPHLSGCHENDKAGFEGVRGYRFLDLVKPTHARFNEFLAKVGHEPYPLGQFFEASPSMNLLLYPKPLAFKRRHAAQPEAVPVSRGLRARRGQIPGAAVQDQQRQAPHLCQLRLARARRMSSSTSA